MCVRSTSCGSTRIRPLFLAITNPRAVNLPVIRPVIRRFPTSSRMKPPGPRYRNLPLSTSSRFLSSSPSPPDYSRVRLPDMGLIWMTRRSSRNFSTRTLVNTVPVVSCRLHLPFVRWVSGIRPRMVVSWVPLRSFVFVARVYLAVIALFNLFLLTRLLLSVM